MASKRETVRPTKGWFSRQDQPDATPASSQDAEASSAPDVEPVSPQDAVIASSQDVLTIGRQDAETVSSQAAEPVEEQNAKQSSSQDDKKVKRYQVTVYLEKSDIKALDDLISTEFDRTDKRRDRSWMVREAIRLLASQNSSS